LAAKSIDALGSVCLLAGPLITPADAIFVTQYDTAGALRDLRATKHGYIMDNDLLTTSKGALVSTEQGRIFGGVESPAGGGACVLCQSPSSRRNIASLGAESFPPSAAASPAQMLAAMRFRDKSSRDSTLPFSYACGQAEKCGLKLEAAPKYRRQAGQDRNEGSRRGASRSACLPFVRS
jgi:hypothetical protein